LKSPQISSSSETAIFFSLFVVKSPKLANSSVTIEVISSDVVLVFGGGGKPNLKTIYKN
jgi:hypothetical protein